MRRTLRIVTMTGAVTTILGMTAVAHAAARDWEDEGLPPDPSARHVDAADCHRPGPAAPAPDARAEDRASQADHNGPCWAEPDRGPQAKPAFDRNDRPARDARDAQCEPPRGGMPDREHARQPRQDWDSLDGDCPRERPDFGPSRGNRPPMREMGCCPCCGRPMDRDDFGPPTEMGGRDERERRPAGPAFDGPRGQDRDEPRDMSEAPGHREHGRPSAEFMPPFMHERFGNRPEFGPRWDGPRHADRPMDAEMPGGPGEDRRGECTGFLPPRGMHMRFDMRFTPQWDDDMPPCGREFPTHRGGPEFRDTRSNDRPGPDRGFDRPSPRMGPRDDFDGPPPPPEHRPMQPIPDRWDD